MIKNICEKILSMSCCQEKKIEIGPKELSIKGNLSCMIPKWKRIITLLKKVILGKTTQKKNNINKLIVLKTTKY